MSTDDVGRLYASLEVIHADIKRILEMQGTQAARIERHDEALAHGARTLTDLRERVRILESQAVLVPACTETHRQLREAEAQSTANRRDTSMRWASIVVPLLIGPALTLGVGWLLLRWQGLV